MVFVNTKREGEHLSGRLQINDYKVAYLSGDIAQNKRLRIVEDFKAGKLNLLVATDVASRGLHVDNVTHVVNYDLPQDAEDYVHRIGRTARAGLEGTAVSLVCIDELKLLQEIEKLLKRDIKKEYVPGYEVDTRIKADPIQKGRQRRQGGPRPAGNSSGGARRPAKSAGSNQRKRFSKSRRSSSAS
jgi:ATP-dependent RNA helicase RhlE